MPVLPISAVAISRSNRKPTAPDSPADSGDKILRSFCFEAGCSASRFGALFAGSAFESCDVTRTKMARGRAKHVGHLVPVRDKTSIHSRVPVGEMSCGNWEQALKHRAVWRYPDPHERKQC
jgi:hypothetical protein